MRSHGGFARNSKSGRLIASKERRANSKAPETLLADPAKQIIIEKDDLDLFTNPAVLPLLDTLRIDECFVYGVFTEYCVKCAIMGLLKTGRKVSLVMRATAHLSEAAGESVIRDFVAAGGQCV